MGEVTTRTLPVFITAKEVAAMCGCSVSRAYRFVAECNEELEAKGKLVMSGRTNRRYFMKKLDAENV